MKFIVEESTGYSVANFLEEEDHNTVFVGNEMLGAEDEDIMEKASDENRVIVTNDKDFGELAVR